jgi:hypothetical protein
MELALQGGDQGEQLGCRQQQQGEGKGKQRVVVAGPLPTLMSFLMMTA